MPELHSSSFFYDYIYRTWGYRPVQRRIIEAVPGGSRVLDVGCSTGYLGEALIDRGCIVYGIEPDRGAASRALALGYTDVYRGKVETFLFKSPWAETNYDFIIFADILEHLVDPWKVLKESRNFLSSTGRVVISVPNFVGLKNRTMITRGRFDYKTSGPLDITHLRFFTYNTAVDMVKEAGYDVEHIIIANFEGGWLGRLLYLLFPNLFVRQFMIVGRKKE